MRSPKVLAVPMAALVILLGPSRTASSQSKLDPILQAVTATLGSSRVIVRGVDGVSSGALATAILGVGGLLGRPLPIIDAQAAVVPNLTLGLLADLSIVAHISADRPVAGAMERTGPTVGAPAARQELGVDGSGVTVAIVDSGVTSWHDDLGNGAGGQRVREFVDFVNGASTPYDDYGHGTHVAGIVAGNGFDSNGLQSGIAPGTELVILKALDKNGNGRISNVIAALDYVVQNHAALNIRVVNLSIGAGVFESYNSDPLTLAAKRAVEAGVVVVAAAGNAGRDPHGNTMYGGITAPGNAPWVLTVGASSHMGTIDRGDDTMAAFSSRGPTAYDFAAKPDLVAPGVGTESLSDPGGTMYSIDAPYLQAGTIATPPLPYLSLSGTSMSTPVVTGTVALMLEANPALTPNLVKAILQYTAQVYPGYDALTEGAGFLNARGAVELAAHFAELGTIAYPSSVDWSERLVWGNHVVSGGQLTADANAWSATVQWGSTWTSSGQSIVWGIACSAGACDPSTPWQTWCADAACTAIGWGDVTAANAVWGATCGGADCLGLWSILGAGSAVTGASGGDTVVWGSSGGDTVVWGSSTGDTVVWGSSCSDSSCTPVVWGKQ